MTGVRALDYGCGYRRSSGVGSAPPDGCCRSPPAPELHRYEWASFTTADFPENPLAGSGDVVRIVIRDGDDRRPVEDLLWLDGDYRCQLEAAGLSILETHRPLGREAPPQGFAPHFAP